MESDDYQECSKFVVDSINAIMQSVMDSGENKIVINTNLKLGLPMENINKVAGPFVEAWAIEKFNEAFCSGSFELLNVEAGERLNMADIILQFKMRRKRTSAVTGNVDVKATSNDIPNSGKSPNITSFARIRSAYVNDPDFIFIILSMKHKVYSETSTTSGMKNGIMEVVDFNTYDLKLISERDISYNPALGTGQIQIRDIHYVSIVNRTTNEFCKLLDKKFIASKKGFVGWLEYAEKKGWIK
jgi:hypothetical protein